MSDYIVKSKLEALATIPPIDCFNIFLDDVDGYLKKKDHTGNISKVYLDGTGIFAELGNNLSDLTNPYQALANIGGEPAFSKNTAFNKNFGINAGEVVEGNDSRFSTLFANTTNNNNSIGVLSTNLANVVTEQNSQGTRITDLENISYTIDLNANQLRLLKDGNQIGVVDLSIYLDDTNLSRLVNGNLDANTGIATFERDDNSTFTVDFSPLFDNTNLSRIISGNLDTNNNLLTFTRDDNSTFDVDLSSLGGNIVNVNANRLYKTFTDAQPNINNSTNYEPVLYKPATAGTYDNTVFSPVANGVQLLKDLDNVTVIGSVFVIDNVGQRTSLGVSVTIDGTVSTIEDITYIRRISGTNEDLNQVIENYQSLPAGTVITISKRRQGVASTNANGIEDKGMLSVQGFEPNNGNALIGFPTPVITSISLV